VEVSLANKNRLNQHISDHHSLHPGSMGATRDFEFDDDDRSSGATLVTDEQCDTAINMVECAISAVFLQSTYGREESVNYFKMEHYGEMLGVNSLIERAVLLDESPSRNHLEANPIPIAEVDLQFQLAKLHLSLPKALSAELAFVCGKIMDNTREDFKALDKQQYNPKCIIPTSVAAVHATYTRGKNAILNHLPHALVLQLDDNHTYCPLLMIIADCLGHKSSLDCCWNYLPNDHDPDTVAKVYDTKRGIQLLEHFRALHHSAPSLTIHLSLWSDDHEPNSTKDNRGSIWTLTVTIATKEKNGYSTEHTCPVALIVKGVSHDAVFDRLAQDLCMLCSSSNFSVYVSNAEGNLKVNALMFTYLADSPEKRHINVMFLGNGIMSPRFGYSTNLKDCYLKFHACALCISSLEA
jgi:hypothetical protein